MGATDEGMQDAEFELLMAELSHEAEARPKAAGASGNKPGEPSSVFLAGISAISRAVANNASVLSRMEEAITKHSQTVATLQGVKEAMDEKRSLNTKLFDALHEELRTYKDQTLFELVHKPVVRELITLHDDFCLLYANSAAALASLPQARKGGKLAGMHKQLSNIVTSLDHAVHSILETMARMEVEVCEIPIGLLDKQMQRAVAVEPTADEARDGMVARIVKPGFFWRQRLIRPQEVVVYKYRAAVSSDTSGA
jgi:molecular chaperone GrpE (heat shock protein)